MVYDVVSGEAFADLFTRCHQAAVATAQSTGLQRADAEDVVSATFLSLFGCRALLKRVPTASYLLRAVYWRAVSRRDLRFTGPPTTPVDPAELVVLEKMTFSRTAPPVAVPL